MRCAACALDLETADNYCRRCGAPVRMVGVQAIPEQAPAVRIGPSTPSLLAGAARPLAAGAAVVAAGALARFAARQVLRGLVGGAAPARTGRGTHVVPRQSGGRGEVIELYWYRRIARDR